MTTTHTPTQDMAIQALAERDFSRWSGLPDDGSLIDLTSRFSKQGEWSGVGELGERDAEYLWIDVAGYKNPLRVWYEGDRVLVIDVENPEIKNPGKLLVQLGQPEAQLNTWQSLVPRHSGEWVYAKRGLALFLDPSTRLIFHLAVFPPTTLADYQKNLRINLRMVRLPNRGYR
jgi:hypothetical protein